MSAHAYAEFLKAGVPYDDSIPWIELADVDSWARFEGRVEDYKTLRAILSKERDLSEDGVGATGWGRTYADACDQFCEARIRMLGPHSLDQFRKARQWLRQFPKLKRVSRCGTSYGLEIGYLTNGVFIAAAIAEGFPVEQVEGAPNAAIGVSGAAWR